MICLLVLVIAGIGGAQTLPSGCAWLPALGLRWILSCNSVLELGSAAGGLASHASREPGDWLPQELRPTQAYTSLVLANLTLALPSCERLWELHELECSSSISATWPSPGLQAGPAYLAYRALVGARSIARRVNITCPLQDWVALLAARGEASSGSGTAPLAPCGTAIVTTGTQLLEAMRQLQLNHTRVLVTLDASMALPAQPTPQRDDATPDDTTPLLRIYRNLTLAGGGVLSSRTAQAAGGGVTQLDLRLHRNAFQVAEQPAAGQSRHVFVTADLQMVNVAYGPPSTWPLGLLRIVPYDITVDRNRSGAGLQTVELRVQRVLAPGASEYMDYWYRRMSSPDPVERGSAMWLQQLGQTTDDAGWNVSVARVADYGLAYNSSFLASPLLESLAQPDFDLWSDLPPQLPGSAQPALLPPSSFAVATSGVQLLALLQEAWVGGPRAILLPTNITLQPGEWPHGGAALSYNVTLVGPVAGQPVWLHASGLQLARPAAAVAEARPVQLQLLRLRLTCWSPALRGPAAGEAGPLILSALDTSPGLRQWRDRCWGSVSTSPTAIDAIVPLRYELYDCTVEFPKASLEASLHYTTLTACAASASTPEAAAGCGLQPLLKRPVGVLLQWAAAISAQTALNIANTSSSGAVVDGQSVLLVNSSIESRLDGLLPPSAPQADGTAGAAASTDDVPCGLASLLLLSSQLLLVQVDTADGPARHASFSPIAAAVGGAVGGCLAVALCVAAVIAVLHRSRRRRREAVQGKQGDPAETLSDGAKELSVVLVEVNVPGPTGGGQADGTVAAGRRTSGDYGGSPASLQQLWESGGDLRLTFSTLAPSEEAAAKVRHTMMDDMMSPPPPPVRVCVAGAELRPAGGPHGDAADAPQGSAWMAMEGELNRMISGFQMVAQAATPREGPSRSRTFTELGRGAFGVVMLSRWRGLPVAVKLVLLQLDGKQGRRERLAREVALTITLVHPHIVPTYDFKINHIREDNAAALASMQEPLEEEGVDPTGGAVVAMQLRIVMQYCELGTLKDALRRGVFGAAHDGPVDERQADELETSASECAAPSAAVVGRGRGSPSSRGQVDRATQPAAAARPGVGLDSADAAGAETAAAPVPLDPPPPLVAAGVGGARARLLSWDDVKPVPNLVLALMAARDVLSGLEYLHRCAVVHGDLTEGNILVKQVRPKLPPGPPPGPGQSTGPAATTAMRRGGGGSSAPVPRFSNARNPAPDAVSSLAGAAGLLRQAPAMDDAPLTNSTAARAAGGSQPPALACALAPVLSAALPSSTPGGADGPSSNGSSSSASSVGGAAAALWRQGSTMQLTTTGSADVCSAPPRPFRAAGSSAGRQGSSGLTNSATAVASGTAQQVAERLLRYSFKLADFGLSVQMKGPDQTHASDMAQGTPYFAAPEVVMSGRMSTAADCYSFGVVLWMLLHGVTLADIRHLLRFHICAPIGPELRRHTSPALPSGAHSILRACLQLQPQNRPPATELRRQVEELLQEVAGPELAWMLLGAERVEVTTSLHQPL